MKTLHEQLAPHIRRVGLSEVVRRCDMTGIDQPMLSSWVNGVKRSDKARIRQPNAAQIDAIAKAVGVVIEVSTTNEN